MLLAVIEAVAVVGVCWLVTGVRVIKQYERGVVFRFGKVRAKPKTPGLRLLIPIADRRSHAQAGNDRLVLCCHPGGKPTASFVNR